MRVGIIQKQNFIFYLLVIMTVALATYFYKITQEKWIYYRVALQKTADKEYTEAIAFYEKSIRLGNTKPRILFDLAEAYVAQGNFAEAIKWYKVYLNEDPQSIKAHLGLARALSWNGQLEESEKEYSKIIQMEKQNED